jgi:hypothetical protein
MADYGIDLLALDDLPDPEVLGAGELNVAHALARRLLQPANALAEIGETDPFDSLDVRDWLGRRIDRRDIEDLETQAAQVLEQDERVDQVDVSATFAGGQLRIEASGAGKDGPFELVLLVGELSATLLGGA